ncbi:MAG: archease [Anaerolineales bacterium]|nr:archease [Anaerolineales bacterium]
MALEPYREIDHTADVALRVHGHDLAELLVNAANGMVELAGIETQAGPRGLHPLNLCAPDAETLLVTWLEEILSQAETEHTLLEDYTIRVTNSTVLEGEAWTAPIRHIGKEIKAVTFHDLEIRPGGSGLEATIVFDV